MAIPDEDVARVRAATDLADLVGEHTALKRVGRRFVGLCPFHGERSPSFSVNAEEGLYYCFGCQARGDAISFVRATEGCDFVEAVERLAARAGLAVRDDADPGAAAERGRRQQLMEVVSAAAAFYHQRLLEHPDAGRARHYLRSRGYDGDVVRRFGIGFAPAGYDELVKALRRPASLMRAAGLAHEGSRGRLVDTLRERVVFPISDPAGRPIALGGRVLPPELRTSTYDPGPKYRNSPESPIYQKRRTLYGLNWAKAEVARVGEVVVCEGYTDVIGFFSAGVPLAVATCGTSLTEEHLRLLGRFAKRVILAFDADKAGQRAAARLYEWERRHELELAVAELPAGSDPGELSRQDPAALAAAVQNAKPFLGFRVERALSEADLSTPEGRVRALDAALSAIGEHPNALIRDQYLLLVADRTRQDTERLRPLLEEARRAAERRARDEASASVRRSAPTQRQVHEPKGQPEPVKGARGQSARRPTGAPVASRPDADGGAPPVSEGEPPPYEDDGRYEDEPGELDLDGAPVGVFAPRSDRPAKESRAAAGESTRASGRPTSDGGPGREAPGGPRGRVEGSRAGQAVAEGPRPGRDALLLAIHRPSEVAQLLDLACFIDPVQRAAFSALGEAAQLHEAIDAADPAAAELLARLAASGGAEDLDPTGTVLQLVAAAGQAVLRELQSEARLTADSDRERFAATNEAVGWLSRELMTMTSLGGSEAGSAAALEAAGRLVAWLAQRQRLGESPGLEG
ncbi:MAG: dnaG [Acidimicrobiaceae bacterium]|nr:dnaG [Acidimicrobiaceae bacterium]